MTDVNFHGDLDHVSCFDYTKLVINYLRLKIFDEMKSKVSRSNVVVRGIPEQAQLPLF